MVRYCACIAAGMVVGVVVLAVTAAALIEFVGFSG
jgi:hypothetical protein